jgi:hypothetical protein
MALAKKRIIELYQKRAGFYDFSANLYYLIGTLDLADRHPWEAVERYLDLKAFNSFYFGAIYVAAGEKR